MTGSVLVAPREVHDLVFRCARVAGCDAGGADRTARNVTAAEIRFGGALAVGVDALASGAFTSTWAMAADALVAAEVDARDHGSATATFDPPVPLAALAATVAEASARGVVVSGIPSDATGGLELATLDLAPGQVEPAAGPVTDAHRDGLSVDRRAFAALVEVAAAFLVAEEALDALEN